MFHSNLVVTVKRLIIFSYIYNVNIVENPKLHVQSNTMLRRLYFVCLFLCSAFLLLICVWLLKYFFVYKSMDKAVLLYEFLRQTIGLKKEY